jgi:hypothetical protein
MKDTGQHREAEARMRSLSFTAEGFFGEDARHLAEIIEADEGAFRRLGLDFEAVAGELERLRDLGEGGLGESVTVEGKWLAQAGEARGKLPCPYGDGLHHKNSITVRRLDSEETLIYSDLSIHLLREHHFCQGRNSSFRLEPASLKRILFPD